MSVQVLDLKVRHYPRSELTDWTSEGLQPRLIRPDLGILLTHNSSSEN